jgi:hypothetical protein
MRGWGTPTNCRGSQKLPASAEVRNVHDEITDAVQSTIKENEVSMQKGIPILRTSGD